MGRNKRRVEGVQKNPQSRQRESSRDATLQKRAVIHKVIGLPGCSGRAVKVLRSYTLINQEIVSCNPIGDVGTSFALQSDR